ncbi:hypothetical protein K504DRAFT_503672 [Pleomassaria siparia CBS 279.74]|uniref:Uncharacterized protein n=1 Tax=Pleomassaria siparia CBS 279.74 TaxID=1314801 RepID=A0A6G1K6J2_9PLEO|nr:hypothetical protein K504DRAFT_503672 [Pleomassaria siparia CBS 279.74]
MSKWSRSDNQYVEKTMPPPAPTLGQFHKTLVGRISLTQAHDAFHIAKPEFCEHKSVTACDLPIPVCCACADKRPTALVYKTYVDGIGDVEDGTRWQNYCFPCMAFWIIENSSGRTLTSPISLPPAKISLRFRVSQHWVTYPTVLNAITARSLKTELATHLSCEPSKFVLECEGIELWDTYKYDLSSFLGRNKQIYCYRIGPADQDHDPMDSPPFK